MKWFSQPSSQVAHFYRDLNAGGFPIPLCHCKPEEEEESGAVKKSKRTSQGMSKMPEQICEGFQMLHMMGKRLHKPCLAKVPLAVAELFARAPP